MAERAGLSLAVARLFVPGGGGCWDGGGGGQRPWGVGLARWHWHVAADERRRRRGGGREKTARSEGGLVLR